MFAVLSTDPYSVFILKELSPYRTILTFLIDARHVLTCPDMYKGDRTLHWTRGVSRAFLVGGPCWGTASKWGGHQ